jgi:uncharacterized membrane protein
MKKKKNKFLLIVIISIILIVGIVIACLLSNKDKFIIYDKYGNEVDSNVIIEGNLTTSWLDENCECFQKEGLIDVFCDNNYLGGCKCDLSDPFEIGKKLTDFNLNYAIYYENNCYENILEKGNCMQMYKGYNYYTISCGECLKYKCGDYTVEVNR